MGDECAFSWLQPEREFEQGVAMGDTRQTQMYEAIGRNSAAL